MPEDRTLLEIAEGLGIDGTGRTGLWRERLTADRKSVDAVRTASAQGAVHGAGQSWLPEGAPLRALKAGNAEHAWTRLPGETVSDRVESHLDAISAHADLNAFTRIFARESREDAHELDRRLARGDEPGPLAGAIVAVKDVMRIRGSAASAGTRAFHMDAGDDATVVARLRAAGAVIIGAANLHALAYGPFSTSSDFGVVGNPLNSQVVAGGSSGGSAAAVAAGLADLAIGTDTAGSIRMPAALCGVVGLKPTFGSVPTEGCQPLARTLDHIGPLARSVADVRAALSVLSGSTRQGGQCTDGQGPSDGPPLDQIRVGLPETYIERLLSPTVGDAFDCVLGRLRRLGAEIVPVTLPRLEIASSIMLCTLGAEAFSTFRDLLSRRASQLPLDVRLRLETGMFVSAADYLHAQELRDDLRRGIDAAFADVDVLMTPTIPIAAPSLDEIDGFVDGTDTPVRAAMNRLTLPFNLSGHPALSLPLTTDPGGAGIGLQIVAPRGDEAGLLSIAAQLETHIGMYTAQPTATD